ncbi:NAD(P)-binding domain-containing protein [Actinokineospora auranticolor]|uniref:3-hydroxyisobutyrate dehydrogenase-like beta-hydroxyacid dehydrogenase n=1 Tax=Actinokineospora auranticolor TaxID=155976 RepID=A0A2S6GBS1_9PSEU|nr:NAD(P)-binding domain-containing protein [Actinokineospora auranticolor]PPK61597.1 3-hydroxyisobutyrate dehydrogenase-like beta-hydroxyacid dehydrogenase [Actinokineospora auranticolor]
MSITFLGLGNMGTAIVRTWLKAGYAPTVWNRTPAKAEALAAEGATAAPTAAAAVEAADLVVVCLLDDATVTRVLADLDLASKGVLNLTTSTPGQARAHAERHPGARFLDGGVMATPPMIGTPGAVILYSGDRDVFDRHADPLRVLAAADYLGDDPGHASLYDIALLSGMYGMFAGVAHALAMVRAQGGVDLDEFGGRLVRWITAMTAVARNDDPAATIEMQAANIPTFEGASRELGVSSELLAPYFELMRRGAAQGQDDLAGLLIRG